MSQTLTQNSSPKKRRFADIDLVSQTLPSDMDVKIADINTSEKKVEVKPTTPTDELPCEITLEQIKKLSEKLKWLSGSLIVVKTSPFLIDDGTIFEDVDVNNNIIVSATSEPRTSEPLRSVLAVRVNKPSNEQFHRGWAFPGGSFDQEKDETIIHTISREFCEELRITDEGDVTNAASNGKNMQQRVYSLLTDPTSTVCDLLELPCFETSDVTQRHALAQQPLIIKWGLNFNARKALKAMMEGDDNTLNTFAGLQSGPKNKFPMVLVGWLACPISLKPILDHWRSTVTTPLTTTIEFGPISEIEQKELTQVLQQQTPRYAADITGVAMIPWEQMMGSLSEYKSKFMGPTAPVRKPFVVPTDQFHHETSCPLNDTDRAHNEFLKMGMGYALTYALNNGVNSEGIITKAPFHIRL